MSEAESPATNSLRRHVLVIAAMFEAFFVYLEVRSLVSLGHGAVSFGWVIGTVMKIGLGYLTFRLYSAQKKSLALLGAALTVAVIVVTTVVFWLSPHGLSPIFGGYILFLLTANSLLFIRYLRNKRAVRLILGTWVVPNVIALDLVTAGGLILALVSNNTIAIWSTLLGWMFFYLAAEGVPGWQQEIRSSQG